MSCLSSASLTHRLEITDCACRCTLLMHAAPHLTSAEDSLEGDGFALPAGTQRGPLDACQLLLLPHTQANKGVCALRMPLQPTGLQHWSQHEQLGAVSNALQCCCCCPTRRRTEGYVLFKCSFSLPACSTA